MKRAAITGIAGQDGTYLARGLLRRGYEVHGLLQFPFDREEPVLRRRYPADEFHAVRWMTGSLEDPFSLVRFLKAAQPDEIYHLAGLTDSRQSFLVPEESVLSITSARCACLKPARAVSNARLFLASSAEVFGVPAETPQSETTLKQPRRPTASPSLRPTIRAAAPREVWAVCHRGHALQPRIAVARPPNYLSRRLSLGVAAIKRGETKELQLGDLSAERDWSDARDVVQAMWLSLQAAQTGMILSSPPAPQAG
jgi:GDPmannose 4,6-dehydratase